jgi:predicted P-loop ATPase
VASPALDEGASPPVYRHRLRDACFCGGRHGPDSARRSEGRDSVHYIYQDAEGRDVIRVTVLGHGKDKKVFQNRWDGTEWKKGVGARPPPVLYRLPEVLASTGTVYVVEGERDAETLRARGFVATTHRGGADAWPRADWAPLRGRQCVLLVDADEAGRRRGEGLGRLLGVPALECAKGKDVTDHFAAGGEMGDFVPMVPGTVPGTPEKAATRIVVKVADWRAGLLYKVSPDGSVSSKLRPIAANAATILVHDERWDGVIAYDEFAESMVTLRVPPWRLADMPSSPEPGDWTEEDTVRCQSWLADAYALDLGIEAVLSSVKVAARRRVIHPVRDWLMSLRWDGTRRLPTWLVTVMGSEDTPYTRAVGQAWAVSAVARVFEPGCKVDTAIVLEGRPGTFKSSVLRALVGDKWFLEMSAPDMSSKDAMQVLRRKWIAEFPEIDALSRTDQGHVKSYFSRQVDTYRASYGKGSRDYPRQTVFAATTNKPEWLTDETGGTGRRMWPVQCTRGDVAVMASMRDQFWAEARSRYESGEKWHITDPEIRDAEREEQDARFRPDPWEQPLAEWLASPAQISSKKAHGVTTSEALDAVQIDVGKRDNGHAARAGNVLRRLGWVPGKHAESRNGARVRVYRPIEGSATNGHTLVPIDMPPDGWVEPVTGEDAFPPADVI